MRKVLSKTKHFQDLSGDKISYTNHISFKKKFAWIQKNPHPKSFLIHSTCKTEKNWNKWDKMRLLSTGRRTRRMRKIEMLKGEILKSKVTTLRIRMKGIGINFMSCRFHKSDSPSFLVNELFLRVEFLRWECLLLLYDENSFFVIFIFFFLKKLNFKFMIFYQFVNSLYAPLFPRKNLKLWLENFWFFICYYWN